MTHVLLAVSCLLRRADGVDVIGAALRMKAAGAGHRPIAGRLTRPASTVRGLAAHVSGQDRADSFLSGRSGWAPAAGSPLLREFLGAQVGITCITLGELTRWATLRQWGPTRRTELHGWLATRPTLPYSDDVACVWDEISAHASPPAERHLDRGLLPGRRPPPSRP